MATFSVARKFCHEGGVSEKARAVMRMFGLTVERLRDGAVRHECTVSVEAGDIVYITGPSGAGKSVLLREFAKAVPASEMVDIGEIELITGRSVVDCIAGDVMRALGLLSIAGLNDVWCMLNEPRLLSEGQRWRFRLAMALSAGKKYVFADEFCNGLDRVSAAVISYNVRKFANRKGVTFFLASCHDDTLVDLAADVVIIKEMSGGAEVVYKRRGQR